MKDYIDTARDQAFANLSRRGFLAGLAAGTLVLGTSLPARVARAQGAAGASHVPAFLSIGPDGTVTLQSPFAEGGQGIFTAMAQIVGEELDADPSGFVVSSAPAGEVYKVMNGGTLRITGGSQSVRTSYETMRRLGATARRMLLETAADRLGVPVDALATDPGEVVHAASGTRLAYGELAAEALDRALPDDADVVLKSDAEFRWIRRPVARLDVLDKSTGRAVYTIDTAVDGMIHAAVQHAPRNGLSPVRVENEAEVLAMTGVSGVEMLDGAVAVLAPRWWDAKRAAEALQVVWDDPGDGGFDGRYMPAGFSSDAFGDRLAAGTEEGLPIEETGDARSVLEDAEGVVSATYRAQYLQHAQLEPPSCLARFNGDGSLEVWVANQAPEMFQAAIAERTGLEAAQVSVHSPLLGGFFGRHFLYANGGSPWPQAVELARRAGRPVKVIWTREEEFLRDPVRPMAVVRFRGVLGADGLPAAIEGISATEGPNEGQGTHDPSSPDPMATEGLTGKAYAVPNLRIAQVYAANAAPVAYWRSVGHSMNDFLYEGFLDELADSGGVDPFEMRMRMLEGNARMSALLAAAADLSGGWRRGPYEAADGTTRARGVAMASPFGSHAAAIAEVSIRDGEVVVHDIWEAVDPGSIVNPAICDAQIRSAAALGLSQVLVEETRFENGMPYARNFDLYPILPPSRMARIHTRIVESGETMGGIGEPPLPAIPPAVANAVSHLTGIRVRRMPLSRMSFAT